MSRLYLVFFAIFIMTAAGAHAAQPPIGNNKQPIDITADRLEVFQEENRAVFTGRVVAIQGDTKLTSDKMTVHYYASGENKGAQNKDSVRRIEFEKNVFLSTPAETASGTSGVYDVEHQEIVLVGEVVLTRDRNTLQGNHLTYDLNTGKSVLENRAAAERPSGGASKPGRVRALFIPEGAKEESAKESQKTP